MERTAAGLIVPDGTNDPEPPPRGDVIGCARYLSALATRYGFTANQLQDVGREILKEARRRQKRTPKPLTTPTKPQ